MACGWTSMLPMPCPVWVVWVSAGCCPHVQSCCGTSVHRFPMHRPGTHGLAYAATARGCVKAVVARGVCSATQCEPFAVSVPGQQAVGTHCASVDYTAREVNMGKQICLNMGCRPCASVGPVARHGLHAGGYRQGSTLLGLLEDTASQRPNHTFPTTAFVVT